MIIKCKMCGGDMEISADQRTGTCEYCGSTMTLPRIDDEQRAAAFNRGNHFRRIGEFDKALAVYEGIVREDETDAEAHWCCALCRFGTGLGESTGELIGSIANEIAGYKVNIISYLYRLDWNEELLDQFLTEYWIDASNPDPAKKAAFEASDLFSLSYVGYTMTSAENVSSKTFSQKPLQEQFLKVCTRALDKAIVELQREYDEFKIKVPIYAMNEDGTVSVKIGLKEGVTEKSAYEVLVKDMSSGVAEYVRVGMLKPVAGKIWDNRFGALEEAQMLEADRKAAEEEAAESGAGTDEGTEAAAEATIAEAEEVTELEEGNPYLDATVFEITSGANKIFPGMLIREVKIK